MELDQLLGVERVAEVLDMSPWTVRAWIQQGKLGSVKLGSRRLVRQSEVQRIVAQGDMPALDEESSTSKQVLK